MEFLPRTVDFSSVVSFRRTTESVFLLIFKNIVLIS